MRQWRKLQWAIFIERSKTPRYMSHDIKSWERDMTASHLLENKTVQIKYRKEMSKPELVGYNVVPSMYIIMYLQD